MVHTIVAVSYTHLRTDIDEVFETVMGFLKTANATKKTTVDVIESVEKEKAKLEATERMRLEAMM